MTVDKNDTDREWLLRISPCVHIVGFGLTPGRWTDKRRMIADHALQAVGAGGAMDVDVDGRSYRCGANSFLIVPPDALVGRAGRCDRPFTRYWIHFDWVYRGDWPPRPWRRYVPPEQPEPFDRPAPAFVPDGVLHGRIPRPRRFFQDFERLNDRWHFGSPANRWTCRGLVLEMLIGLLAPGSKDPGGDPGVPTASRIRRKLRRLAETPFHRAPSVREYLSRGDLSYDHQARVFRAACGMTPMAYVNSLRIARAQAMLTDTDHPVKQVALHLGFRDSRYFARLFRKITGLSPTAYRRADAL
jgi:AraC-like DNA-binding protein